MMIPVIMEPKHGDELAVVPVDEASTLTAFVFPDRLPRPYERLLQESRVEAEIEQNPEEAARLQRARGEIRKGAGRWLPEGQSLEDLID